MSITPEQNPTDSDRFETRNGVHAAPVRILVPGKTNWRRRQDSNLWNPFGLSGFQDHRLKPLGHSSIALSR